jgi:hypothetical protein
LPRLCPLIRTQRQRVQVCAHPRNGSISRQFHMDMVTDQDTFYCKLHTSARLINSQENKASSLPRCQSCSEYDDLRQRQRSHLTWRCKGLLQQGYGTSSGDIVGIRFSLNGHAAVLTPDSLLQKRSSMILICILFQVSQCEKMTDYVPRGSMSECPFRHCLILRGSG